ncbi:MAG: BBP7 family outer membrane beta-barrel protein [Planctomycetes bacterium]|nr:BBP7 family outer membrane beta-barrel protein [Planctomycetota bacterium]
MKAVITIVAMTAAAWAAAPQRVFAQYGLPAGPGPYGMSPGPMAPGQAPYAAQPAFHGPAGPAPFMGPAPAAPPGYGYYPGMPAGYQQPSLAPPAGPYGPPGAYAPPGAAYGDPNGGYPPPGAAYGDPNGGYPPPDGGYGAPGGYPSGAPIDDYGQPLNYGEGYDGMPLDGGAVCDTCGGDAGVCGCGMGLAPVFFGLEGLLWVRHGQQIPPLVTTSPAGTAAGNAGVIGQGATVLFGGQRVEDGFQPGVRITSGVWLDPMHEVAIGGRLLLLGQDEVEFNASSPTGQPIIARPFIDFNTGNEDAFLAAFDDGTLVNPRTGSINVSVMNDLWGGDAFSSLLLTQGNGYRIDLLAGYQFYRIDEAVSIRSTSIRGDLAPPFNIPAGSTITIEDIFGTQNEFHGGALGAVTEFQQGAFSLKFLGRVAVGTMEQTLQIIGKTTIENPPPAGGGPPLPPVVLPGGILAQPSNTGEFTRDRTVVSPEAAITFGYNVNHNVSLTLGYSFIYWTSVAQAGPHINRRIDLTQVNAVPPPPGIMASDFWVMGLNGGIEWRY